MKIVIKDSNKDRIEQAIEQAQERDAIIAAYERW